MDPTLLNSRTRSEAALFDSLLGFCSVFSLKTSPFILQGVFFIYCCSGTFPLSRRRISLSQIVLVFQKLWCSLLVFLLHIFAYSLYFPLLAENSFSICMKVFNLFCMLITKSFSVSLISSTFPLLLFQTRNLVKKVQLF